MQPRKAYALIFEDDLEPGQPALAAELRDFLSKPGNNDVSAARPVALQIAALSYNEVDCRVLHLLRKQWLAHGSFITSRHSSCATYSGEFRRISTSCTWASFERVWRRRTALKPPCRGPGKHAVSGFQGTLDM